jgi:hypothetical protein
VVQPPLAAPAPQPVSLAAPASLIPISASQPTFAAPSFAPAAPVPPAQPAAVAATPLPTQPQPNFVMQMPGARPAAAVPTIQPLPGLTPGAPARTFGMAGGQPQQPVMGKNTPPADQKTTPAKEGSPWKDFGK